MLDLILESKMMPDLQNDDSTFNCESCWEVLVAKQVQENKSNSLKVKFTSEMSEFSSMLMACIERVKEERNESEMQDLRRAKFGMDDRGPKIQQYKAKAITHMNKGLNGPSGKKVLPHLARFGAAPKEEDDFSTLAELSRDGRKKAKSKVESSEDAVQRELAVVKEAEERYLRELKEKEAEDAREKELAEREVAVDGEMKKIGKLSDDDFERMTDAEYEEYNRIICPDL